MRTSNTLLNKPSIRMPAIGVVAMASAALAQEDAIALSIGEAIEAVTNNIEFDVGVKGNES